ncbi:hypothetical protein GCM10028777_36030 [Angustibacter speluncae]
MSAHPLAQVLRDAAAGHHLPADGGWTRVPPWRDGVEAVLAFTGHAVLAVADDVDDAVLDGLAPDGFGGAHHPRVLLALAGEDGWVDSLDVVLHARGTGGGADLVPRPDLVDHPRARHAREVRDDVRVLGRPEGGSSLVTLARGLGGLTEVSVELDPGERGSGRGTSLFVAARAAALAGEDVLASVAPGNTASLRAALRAGFVPLGSVQLLRPSSRRGARRG